MTWLALSLRKLTDPALAAKFHRLAREIADRNEEAKANPPPPAIDHAKPIKVSGRLRPYIDRIAAEMAAAQAEEDIGA